MKTFIEFLLEEQDKKQASKTLINEAMAAHLVNLDILAKELTDSKCENVIAVTPDGTQWNLKNEFMWKEGESKAILQTSSSTDKCKTKSLINDINAISQASESKATKDIQAKFEVGSDECKEITFFKKAPILYIGVNCDPKKILDDKANNKNASASTAQPEQTTPTPPAEDTKDAISIQIKATTYFLHPNPPPSTSGQPRIIFFHKDDPKNFKKTLKSTSNFSGRFDTFISNVNSSASMYYKQIQWNEAGQDSFIKRLQLLAIDDDGKGTNKSGIMYLAMTFGPHPIVARFKLSASPSYVINAFNQSTEQWLKLLLNQYFFAFNKSLDGVDILQDSDHFFKTSQKYLIQQEPPFKVGKLVQKSVNATPASTSGTGVQPNAADAKPVSAATTHKTVYSDANEKFTKALAAKGLGALVAGIGAGGSGLIKGPFKTLQPGSTYMSLRFPGADSSKMFDEDAITFLTTYGVWNKIFKPLYDEAKKEIPDLKLALSFDGKFNQQ